MLQDAKQFQHQLNKILDDMGVSNIHEKRIEALSVLLHSTRRDARQLLDGFINPDDNQRIKIAEQLDVDPSKFSVERRASRARP